MYIFLDKFAEFLFKVSASSINTATSVINITDGSGNTVNWLECNLESAEKDEDNVWGIPFDIVENYYYDSEAGEPDTRTCYVDGEIKTNDEYVSFIFSGCTSLTVIEQGFPKTIEECDTINVIDHKCYNDDPVEVDYNKECD